MNEPSRRRSISRLWIGRLLLVACSAAATLALAEVAFRAMHWYRPRPRTYVGEFANVESETFATDPMLGWRMRPGLRFTRNEGGRNILYAADEHGFRIDPAASRPRDARRLVSVGDSFTYGAGVPAADSYPVLLAGLLGGWALTNMAQPGYALDQVWQSLVHDAVPRSPDLVIAGIYPEDFERSLVAYRQFEGLNKPTFRLESGRLVQMTADDRPGPVTRFLEGSSRVFTLARQISMQAGFRFGIGEMWKLNEAMLDDMMRVGKDARVPIVFVHVPPETLEPFPALAEHMKKTGAYFVDPLDAMKGLKEPLYLERNGHLNAAGHRVVAARIETFIREHSEILRVRRDGPASAGPR